LLTTYPSFSPTRSPIGHSLCDNTNYHGYDGIYKDGTLSDAGCRSFCISTIGLSGTPDVLRGYVYTKRFNHRCSCLVDHPMSGTYSGINGVFHGGTSAGVIGGWNQTDVNDAYCHKLYPTVSPTKSPSKSPSTSPTANPSVSPSAPLSTSQTVSPTASPSVNRANSPYASPAANPSVFPRFTEQKPDDAPNGESQCLPQLIHRLCHRASPLRRPPPKLPLSPSSVNVSTESFGLFNRHPSGGQPKF
jgi:hypothetical protein